VESCFPLAFRSLSFELLLLSFPYKGKTLPNGYLKHELPARKHLAAFALIVLTGAGVVVWVGRDTWRFHRQVAVLMEGLTERSSKVAADAKTLRNIEEQYSRIAMKLPPLDSSP